MTNFSVNAWHATSKDRKEKILNEHFSFTPYIRGKKGQRIPNDLGAGTYFFGPFRNDSGVNLARRYYSTYKSNTGHMSLINAQLDCSRDELVDLDDKDVIEGLLSIRDALDHQLKIEFDNLKDDNAKKRAQSDGILIEFMIEYYKKENKIVKILTKDTYTKIDARRSTLPNGKEYCVRDVSLISIIPE